MLYDSLMFFVFVLLFSKRNVVAWGAKVLLMREMKDVYIALSKKYYGVVLHLLHCATKRKQSTNLFFPSDTRFLPKRVAEKKKKRLPTTFGGTEK